MRTIAADPVTWPRPAFCRARGALVLVGGHSRGVGKTAAIEAILRGQGHRRWAAVKVSAHRHAAPHEIKPIIEEDLIARSQTQTGRYLRAGAERAFLCRTPAWHLAQTAGFVRQLRDNGLDVAVESNRLVEFVDADVVLFAVAPRLPDWKASSGVVLRRVDAFLVSDPDEAAAREAVQALSVKRRSGFAVGHPGEAARFLEWLAGRLSMTHEDVRLNALV